MTDSIFKNLKAEFFFKRYFEKLPVLFDSDPQDFITLSDIEFYLTSNQSSYPGIRLVKQGRQLKKELYTHHYRYKDFEFRDRIIPSKIWEYYQDQCTIVITHANDIFSKLQLKCCDFEKIFSCRITANVYISPPFSKGYGLHYDTHDVFVYQQYGIKKWSVYNSPINSPKESQPSTLFKHLCDLESRKEMDLHKDSVLYLPRGFFHEAETSESHSIHISFGLFSDQSADEKLFNKGFFKV